MEQVQQKITQYFKKYAHIFHICNYDIYYNDLGFITDFLDDKTSLGQFTLENMIELLYQFDNYIEEKYNQKCMQNDDLNDLIGQINNPSFTQTIINDKKFNQFINDSLTLLLPYNSVQAIEQILELLSKNSQSKTIAKSLQFIGQDKLNQIMVLGEVIIPRLDKKSVFVDLGGGKGHLSRYINFASKVASDNIYVIERDEKLISQGKRLNDEINFVNMFIDDKRQSMDDIIKQLQYIQGENSVLQFNIVMAAIHTCGSFGVGLIKMLSATKTKMTMVQAPCCYQFITEDYFLISGLFQDFKAQLLDNPSFNLRSFLNIACVDYWKSVGHTQESFLEYQELRKNINKLDRDEYKKQEQILLNQQKQRISDLFEKVSKQKHRRLLYENVNFVLRKIMNHNHKPKRSRVKPDSDNGLFNYFKQQIDTQLFYNTEYLFKDQELDKFSQRIVDNLKLYEQSKSNEYLNKIFCQIYDISNIKDLSNDIRYAYETKINLLYFIHIVQIISCRVLERLLIIDRQQYLLEHDVECKVSLLCHTLLTPRNFLLICDK